MGDTQKISITVQSDDGNGLTRNYVLDNDAIEGKDWSAEIVSMVETLADSLK